MGEGMRLHRDTASSELESHPSETLALVLVIALPGNLNISWTEKACNPVAILKLVQLRVGRGIGSAFLHRLKGACRLPTDGRQEIGNVRDLGEAGIFLDGAQKEF